MIGTVICRNCDTAIEVSEGDVARFRTNPVFACSVCQQDLTQRVAELLGRAPVVLGTVSQPSHPPRASDPNEFTVPDDQEAFDGLPMGESFDDAALRMKSVRTPQATPVMEDPQPEDPSLLALRIAGQAQAQAQALAAKALANASARRAVDDDGSTGVMQIPTWRGASVAPVGAPDTAATEPGIPLPAGSPSTEVGVVPEEPENETTARRATENAEGSVAEPTLPSDGGDDDGGEGDSVMERTAGSGHDERTPLVDITRTPEVSVPSFSESGVLPSSPVNEATPSVSRGNPVLVEEEPPREVTAKRSAPPSPPRIMRTTVPRTGTGPAGIGALGIRMVANRAVVRPASNGKSVSTPAPNAETQITAVEFERERPSAGGRAAAAAAGAAAAAAAAGPAQAPYTPAVPFSSPRAGTSARRSGGGGVPMWAMIGGGTLVLAIASVFIVRETGFLGGRPPPTPTPYAVGVDTPEETPTVTPAQTAIETKTTVSTVTATPATPAPTPTPTIVATAKVMATAMATPWRTPTPAIAVRTATPTPTAVAVLTPRATPVAKPSVATLIDQATLKAKQGRCDEVLEEIHSAGRADISHAEELWGNAWKLCAFAANARTELKINLAEDYVERFPKGKHAPVMQGYMDALNSKKTP